MDPKHLEAYIKSIDRSDIFQLDGVIDELKGTIILLLEDKVKILEIWAFEEEIESDTKEFNCGK